MTVHVGKYGKVEILPDRTDLKITVDQPNILTFEFKYDADLILKWRQIRDYHGLKGDKAKFEKVGKGGVWHVLHPYARYLIKILENFYNVTIKVTFEAQGDSVEEEEEVTDRVWYVGNWSKNVGDSITVNGKKIPICKGHTKINSHGFDSKYLFPTDVLMAYFGNSMIDRQAPPMTETHGEVNLDKVKLYDQGRDPFIIMGIPASKVATISDKEIKVAYRMMARQYHPDTSQLPKDEAEEMFKLLNDANKILSDATQRKKYLAAKKLALMATLHSSQEEIEAIEEKKKRDEELAKRLSGLMYVPPRKCGLFHLKIKKVGLANLVTEILDWQPIINQAGETLSVWWDNGEGKVMHEFI